MKKNWVKILVPIIGIVYCTAFMEVDLPGGIHQTWNDPYDSYIISQPNTDAIPVVLSIDIITQNTATYVEGIFMIFFKTFLFLLIPFFIVLYNSSALFRKNCTFLL